jgi:trigger factor
MESRVEEISPVLVELKISVPWKTVEQGLDDAYKTLQKRAKVRGFRPGKVPRDVVKKLMGASVKQEVSSTLVQQGLGNAVREHSLDPVAVPHISEAVITDGQPLEFVAKLEVRPKIDSVDTSKLDVKREKVNLADAALDAEIDRLREQHAVLVTPEPRPTREGDVLTVDLDVEVDGQARADLAAKDYTIELGEGQLLEELEQGLLGAQPDSTPEIALTFPEDYRHEELKGKAARFRISIKAHKEKVLPALDDEFAKDLEHESLDEMKKTVRADLLKRAEQRSQALLKEAVVEKLIDANPIPVPPSMIDQQTRHMLQEYARFQAMMGQRPNLDETFFEDMKRRAERRVRAGLLFGEVAKTESISVSDADIDARLAEIAEKSGKHIAKVRADYQGERRDDLQAQLLEHKLLEFLLSKATIEDVEPTTDPEESKT